MKKEKITYTPKEIDERALVRALEVEKKVKLIEKSSNTPATRQGFFGPGECTNH